MTNGCVRQWRLAFLYILVLLVFVTAQSDNVNRGWSYHWFCDVTKNPKVTLEWDSDLYEYIVQSPGPVDEHGPNAGSGHDLFTNTNTNTSTNTTHPWTRRLWNVVTASGYYSKQNDGKLVGSFPTSNLRSSTWQPPNNRSVPALAVAVASSKSSHSPARLTQQVEAMDRNQSHGPYGNDHDFLRTVQARSCHCWNNMMWGGAYYCPTTLTHCAIPSSPMGYPGCLDVHAEQRVVRSIWPVLIVWYASVLFCLSFTMTGRHAMSCCIATVYPAWNRQTAERLLRNDPNEANQMLLRHYRISRAQYERRLRRRLRRRASRDRQRARRRRAAADNNNNENVEDSSSSESELEEELPFPNLWDLAIIPRPINNTLADEPQPVSLTLKTRIYRQKNKQNDDKNITNQEDEAKVEMESFMTTNDAHEGGTARLPLDNHDEAKAIVGTDKDSSFEEGRPQKYEPLQTLGDNTGKITTEATETFDETNENKLLVLESDDVTNEKANGDGSMETIDPIGDQSSATSPPPYNVSDWDDNNTCTICYAPLEDGDRVGALPCGHEFHVHPCLKHWLTRRNVCPLCLAENIATPRFADGTPTPANNNDMDGGATTSPIVVSFNPSRDGNSISSSDQDRSSSRDGGDDNSSGIVEVDPSLIPAFSRAPTGRRRPRTIELTSLFRRRRSTPQDSDANTSSPVEHAP
jgi:Ring finger domain